MYRIVVTTAVLLAFAVAGAWATLVLPYALLVSVGASVGLAVGAVFAYLMVHADPTPSRAQRRRQPSHWRTRRHG
jgi:hypothetical protein